MNRAQHDNLTATEKLAASRIAHHRATCSNQPPALKASRLRAIAAEANALGMRLWQSHRAVSGERMYGDTTVLLASHGHFGPDAQKATHHGAMYRQLAQGGLEALLWAQADAEMAQLEAALVELQHAEMLAQQAARKAANAAWWLSAKAKAVGAHTARERNALHRNRAMKSYGESAAQCKLAGYATI